MRDVSKSAGGRRTYLKGIGVGLGAALAGCLGGGGDGDSGGDLEFLTWNLAFLEDSINGYIDDWEEEYGDEYDEFEWTWTDQGGDEVLPYYESGLQGGDPATVLDAEFGSHASFAADGVLADIEQFADDEFLDRFSETSLDLGRYDGTLYAAPFYLNSQMTVSNVEYFDQAGIEPPSLGNFWSTDDYLDNAEQLVEESDAEYGLMSLIHSFTAWAFFFSEDIDILNEEGTEAVLNTDRAVEILTRMAELTDEGIIPEVTWTGDFEETSEFYAVGDTAIGFTRDSALRPIQEQGEDWVDEESIEIGPGPEGGNFAEFHTLSITESDHSETEQQAAFDLIDVITNTEWQKDFLRETTVLVPNEEALDELANDDEYREDRPLLAQLYDQFNTISDDLSVVPIVPELPEIDDIVRAEMGSAGLGEKDPEEALQDAEDRINNALN
ncbi:extracellular solute-binding protein [Natrononativus amylolyticus]|uniref:extracellular solute-binding protein n=1 Tax=Natrononativus amylolyticus TaxID=2963434 RepID=UPI0020CE00A1|nr:extracellular solute-binding protein [Natrononativus amylolyticus]